MRLNQVPEIAAEKLLQDYEALLLDAYGVLLHMHGALPGAAGLIERLRLTGQPFAVLSNDASRRPETSAHRFRAMGLQIDPEQIINSSCLVGAWFASEGLVGARCLVLGPDDSLQVVREAGGEVIPVAADAEFEVLVVCDEEGYPLLETLDDTLTAVVRRARRGEPLRLLLPNPDLIYLRGPDSVGLTSGSIALVIQAALRRAVPDRHDLCFVPLGKPHPPLFESAFHRLSTRNAVMVGDQLATDIAGANGVGIDSALTTFGLTPISSREVAAMERPTWLLPSLTLEKDPP